MEKSSDSVRSCARLCAVAPDGPFGSARSRQECRPPACRKEGRKPFPRTKSPDSRRVFDGPGNKTEARPGVRCLPAATVVFNLESRCGKRHARRRAPRCPTPEYGGQPAPITDPEKLAGISWKLLTSIPAKSDYGLFRQRTLPGRRVKRVERP